MKSSIIENNIKEIKYPKGRKSLAIDVETYNLLEELCVVEHRNKIDQLRFMIENRHHQLVREDKILL
jgi:hypothetical protein